MFTWSHYPEIDRLNIEAETKWPPFLQTTLLNSLFCTGLVVFTLTFHWNVFSWFQLTIIDLWFRSWLGADQATRHNLDQWWSGLLTHICVSRPQWFKHGVKCLYLHVIVEYCACLRNICQNNCRHKLAIVTSYSFAWQYHHFHNYIICILYICLASQHELWSLFKICLKCIIFLLDVAAKK